ncbi:hypothetical protein EYR40_001550 [Pleurotus pulmonarius]|nr:hypothetical protein EYR36_000095 [Pleurotus pulmonarius]KAF4604371.1 hypothetical protein EYR38_004793 [Pleurotus pulmonarius]KAF4609197.1 hypothetical protein EYR40_001550 [Pleurotus pulmonarius]
MSTPTTTAQQQLEQIIRGLRDRQSLGKRKHSSHVVQTEITIDREAVNAATRYLETIGKAISRLADPFRSLDAIVATGCIPVDSPDIQALGEPAKLEHQRFVEAYNILIKRLPGFQSLIDEFQKNEYGTQWESLLQELSHMSGMCRSNDTSSLKKCPRLLLNDIDPTPPELQSIDKSSRGFNSPICANLLCPIKYANEPDAIQRIKDGAIKVRASVWPSFVYADESYDPDNMDHGLLRGWLLVRVMRHIFTGPTTATKPSQKLARGCNARKLGITQVTPNMIAYAAVQARVMLSAASSWTNEDADFNLSIFYDRIINLFRDDEGGEWTQETIAWWNRQVFPGVEAVSDENNDEDEEEDLRLKRQRLERVNRTLPAQPGDGAQPEGGAQTPAA